MFKVEFHSRPVFPMSTFHPILRLSVVLLFFLTCGPVPEQSPPESLKDAAREKFEIGVGISDRIGSHPEDWELLKKHFSIVTPENCMKPQAVQRIPEGMKLSDADRIVEFAIQNHLRVVGHCLVWAKGWHYPSRGLLCETSPCSPRRRGRSKRSFDTACSQAQLGNEGFVANAMRSEFSRTPQWPGMSRNLVRISSPAFCNKGAPPPGSWRPVCGWHELCPDALPYQQSALRVLTLHSLAGNNQPWDVA